ncbi:hypothetical protein M405DRAFT_815097 [Rhizopogon salebrosus TDB-379]|nr:hypothetical protein M405DRAFT_815097 [Rhizopogon salebrosus TDB-379]
MHKLDDVQNTPCTGTGTDKFYTITLVSLIGSLGHRFAFGGRGNTVVVKLTVGLSRNQTYICVRPLVQVKVISRV